jgi:demethylmenaquinone methyltransferase/2-methoxy-6-polyprenyl-1,4-benzoquinol methylase
MQEKYRILHQFIDLYEFIFIFSKERNPRRALAGRIPEDNMRVLDVCFGTGNGSIPFWDTSNIIFGVDVSFDMLAASKKKILRQRRQNVFIHQMDAANMGFHDEQFDIVMVAFGLHDMEYDLMLRVLKEMHRVLRKGGRLYILDYEEEGTFLKRLIFSLYLRISYPQHVQEFLKYDWNQILESIGFRFDSAETYTVSKLISATK